MVCVDDDRSDDPAPQEPARQDGESRAAIVAVPLGARPVSQEVLGDGPRGTAELMTCSLLFERPV